jgi:hypothetical protein
VYLLLSVFLAGLMTGRTPELFGRKIEAHEVRLLALLILLQPLVVLGFTALTLALPRFTGNSNPGFHGISQVFYEYTSAFANNGSGFEGLGDATYWWNLTCTLVLALGRYPALIVPLAVAASLARKRHAPEGPWQPAYRNPDVRAHRHRGDRDPDLVAVHARAGAGAGGRAPEPGGALRNAEMIQQSYQIKTQRGHPALIDAAAFRSSIRDAFLKLAPQHIIKSPVMAIVLGGTLLSRPDHRRGAAPAGLGWAVTAILLVTVLFGNFAEAVAEARGRGQAASLRRARKDLIARRITDAKGFRPACGAKKCRSLPRNCAPAIWWWYPKAS